MKQRELLIISITIFLTFIAWSAAEIYRTAQTQKVKAIRPSVSKPVNITIDIEVFKRLEKKE